MKPPTAAAIDRIITTSAAPLFKDAGYRKRGRSFDADHEGMFRVASFQASRWNTPETAQFTLNLGITIRGFHEAYSPKPFPSNPASAVLVTSIRIGLLRSNRDQWWEIGPESDLDVVAQDVAAAVRDHALPCLGEMGGLAELRTALRGPAPGVEAVHRQCLAWLLVQAGEREEASDVLSDLVRGSRIPGFVACVEAFASRLGITLATA